MQRGRVFWVGIASCLVLLGAGLVPVPRALAEEVAGLEQLGGPVGLHHLGRGSLLLATELPGVYLPAPGLDTEADITVTGLLARTRVRQRFTNPTEVWVEGLYAFPLPAGAAVDGLKMVIGERVVEGEIRERQEAQRFYEEARDNGQRATLVEQERPNLFTTAVANLGPGETIEVVIDYQEELRYDSGLFRLRFPLVAAPRYSPAGSPETPGLAPGAPPVSAEVLNPVRIRVHLDAGFPLEQLESPSHALDVEPGDGAAYEVSLAGGKPVPADRDFVLQWMPAVGKLPGTAVFTEEVNGEPYALVMLMPPTERGAAEEVIPRETVFVLDTSGSMAGESLVQAREALRFGLERLGPADHFNVLQFNSFASKLFAESQPVNAGTVDAAVQYVSRLEANGGTEMLAAFRAALEGPTVDGAVRQVIFITDGEVSNEEEILAYLGSHLGASRLFTVAIGSAPNAYLLEEAASLGRGTFTAIGQVTEVGARMGELLAKLQSPVLAGLELSWSRPEVEVWPAQVPDIYLGEPVVLAARLRGARGFGESVRLSGRRGAEGWSLTVPLGARAAARRAGGVEKLWARRKVAALLRSQVLGADRQEVRREVTALGLGHHLVTPFTSLVAVDPESAAPAGARPLPRKLPVQLPAGWTMPVYPAVLPQGGTAAPLLLLAGLAAFAAAFVLRRWS